MKTKSLLLVLCFLISNAVFPQRTYTEGSFIFEKGEDLAFLVPKKTKMQINVYSDSLIVNEIAPDTLVRYLNNLYGGEGWTTRWKKYREELFPLFFTKAFAVR